MQSDIIRYFAFAHLPAHMQGVSMPVGQLAEQLERLLPDGPEKSAGMRKLLEAKDCFVRSALDLPKPVAPNAEASQTFTFDQFVQFGRDNGGNIVAGMPWSFTFHGHPVTHENDQCYLVGVNDGQVRFTPDFTLVIGPDRTLSTILARSNKAG